jgi:predicted deacylase
VSGAPATTLFSEVAGPGVRMPVAVVRAAAPGPAVVIGANLHGDECTGLGVVHALIRELPRRLVGGVVTLLPSLNPQGLEQGTRRIAGDTADPNRVFPGSARGSLAERHAARIWSEIVGRRPDLYIDLHTDTDGALPYAIVDRVVRGAGDGLEARCLAHAEATGLTVLREYPADRYLRYELDRSLPGALVNQGICPAFTIELGPRRRVDPSAVAEMADAVWGVLGGLGVADAPQARHPSRRDGGPWRRESGPRTTRSGFLVPLRGPGAAFAAGDPLSEVRSLDGDVREVLRAPADGFVVSLPEVARVDIGAATATLAVREERAPRPTSG